MAAAAGVAKPTLYARGGDKEELFALAVEAEVERLLERLEGGVVADRARRWTTTCARRRGARLLFVDARGVGAARAWSARCGGSRSR